MLLNVEDKTFGVDVAGSGEPMLLIHGFPLNRNMWQAQHGSLCQSCKMIVPDLRGFGESSPTTGPMSMDDYATDLAAILDSLEQTEPVTLCGLSMGGYIAFAFARLFPNRVRRMILCNTKAEQDSSEARDNRRRIANEVLELGTEKLIKDMTPKLLAEATLLDKPEIVAAVKEMMESTPAETIASAQHAMATRPDSTDMLSELSMPALVICGEGDAICPPEMMQGMAEAMPNATFSLIENSAHLTPLENPEVTNGVIRKFMSS
ncbi:alpha/beta fold hydrolase [Calycomorphotria hydatis]|uniref:3-oxoadipate enol-lactonase 2 n=1 Tax=Calycomorphotria hydatis TaxID=2528027 RepID=A0A517TBB2_9PLAN|nr:alpha/beta fold hydrolase [Calycomorphotria hydatis]QDT65660.1 3-oxoadipate enol-lactonase 2 [Calycomorphotria hydatis]